mgnify:CR=1 FL=1
MSNSHNKKRNSGLMYEFLVQAISRALVENDQQRSSSALKILKRHYKPGTELYKEFRLINSLIKTTVSSEMVAASIMNEAKNAARAHNNSSLDREKSLLIRNINHGLNDDSFYDQQVNEYRIYATIQTLLNEWRSGSVDITKLAKYEDQLVKWLTSTKSPAPDSTIGEGSAGSNRLLMRVMMQRLNEKYSGVLTEDQKSIVRAYVWSASKDDQTAIQRKLLDVKAKLLESISSFKAENSQNEYVCKKLDEVHERLSSEELLSVNDDIVTRFMLYIKLNNELMEGDSHDNR